jgi:hypothetical protein
VTRKSTLVVVVALEEQWIVDAQGTLGYHYYALIKSVSLTIIVCKTSACGRLSTLANELPFLSTWGIRGSQAFGNRYSASFTPGRNLRVL